MKIKKEYIILGVILIVLIGFLIFQNTTSNTHYKLPKIKKVERADIKKVILTKPDGTITLERENEKWYILPEKYPADQEKVDKILDVITDFAITDLVSESKNYVLYELDDEKKINVKALSSDGKVLLDFDMGKHANTYNHTFVKLKDNPDVYHAKGNFGYDINKKVDDLRDKQVLKFDKNEIFSITLNNNKEELILEKEVEKVDVNADSEEPAEDKSGTPPEETWRSNLGRIIKKDEITNMLNTLADLKCDNYIEGKTKSDFKDPMYTLVIKGTKDYTISIYEKDDSKYSVISSENEYPFMLSSWKTEKFMKNYDDLYEEEK